MDISDFGEEDFKDRDFGEEDLAGLAAVLGLSYEIGPNDVFTHIENEPCAVKARAAWVRFKGLKSKRRAVFVTGKNIHTKRFPLDISFFYKKAFGEDGFSPQDIRRIRDEAAAHAVKQILSGCRVKVSNTRRVEVLPSASVEELKLKLAIAGGCIR